MTRNIKPIGTYAILSNADMLGSYIDALEEAIYAASPARPAVVDFTNIKSMMILPRAINEHPFLKMGYAQQDRLINLLTACLNPQDIRFARDAKSDARFTDIQFSAGKREQALRLLMEIDAFYKDSGQRTASCITDVGLKICDIILVPQMDQTTLESFHANLIAWPKFIANFGQKYKDTLEKLYDVSNRRCDEMTMGWIRRTALPQLDAIISGSRGPEPTSTPA